MIELQVNVATALAELGAVQARAADVSPVLAGPINTSVDTVFQRQFASEGAFGGSRWAPLAPVTLKLRERPGHGRGGILRDTNRLWASLTKLGLGPEAIKEVTPQSLTRGTRVPYARYQETGFTSRTFVVVDREGRAVPLRRRSPKRIPARPIIPDPMPRSVIGLWTTLLGNFIATGAVGAA